MPYGVNESPSRINCADMQLAVERGAIEGVDRPRTLSSGTHVAKRLPKSIHMTDGVPNATVFARRADMKFAIGLGTADVTNGRALPAAKLAFANRGHGPREPEACHTGRPGGPAVATMSSEGCGRRRANRDIQPVWRVGGKAAERHRLRVRPISWQAKSLASRQRVEVPLGSIQTAGNLVVQYGPEAHVERGRQRPRLWHATAVAALLLGHKGSFTRIGSPCRSRTEPLLSLMLASRVRTRRPARHKTATRPRSLRPCRRSPTICMTATISVTVGGSAG